MTLILVDKVDLQKDFLVIKALSVFDSLCDAQNASDDVVSMSGEGGAVLDFIKWVLTLTKEKNNPTDTEKYHLVTPEVHILALIVMGKLIAKMPHATTLEVLPGLSSIASKVLAGDIKASSRVKEAMAEIWL